MTRLAHALSSVVCLVAALGPTVASAEAPPPADVAVDVKLPEEAPPRRVVTLEWSPLPLFTIGRLSASAVVVPADHHALVLSPFYEWATTQPIDVFSGEGAATQLPQQKFWGFGGEIGYRYYTGLGGARGFFVGPSLILAAMTAKPQVGSNTSYLDYGVAADVGYEMLLADAVAVSLGAGVQYTTPSKSIPDQQFPADIYANSHVFPRVLASIGWAL